MNVWIGRYRRSLDHSVRPAAKHLDFCKRHAVDDLFVSFWDDTRSATGYEPITFEPEWTGEITVPVRVPRPINMVDNAVFFEGIGRHIRQHVVEQAGFFRHRPSGLAGGRPVAPKHCGHHPSIRMVCNVTNRSWS